MAPRKKSKAKKPTETMRQRQMRLRREAAAQKAAKNQKALPPGKKGGPLAKTTKALPAGKTAKALPPGKPGGAVTKRGGPAGKVNVKGALGNVALAALAGYVADKANKAANPETWKKKSEELKAAMSKPKPTVKGAGGGQGNRGRTSLKVNSSKYDMDSQPPKGPNQVKPAKPATKAPAKPAPKPAAKPAAKKPAPKPAPARSKTYSQAAMMKDIRAADRAAARSKELKKLKELREEAKRKSLEQAKKNRARGQRKTGPRGY